MVWDYLGPKTHKELEIFWRCFWLDVFEDNDVAIALYVAHGFKVEGMERESVKSEKGFRSLHIYSILKSEYFGLDKHAAHPS